MRSYLKHKITLTILLLLVMHTALACSMNAAGKCGGSACPTGEACVVVSEFKCDCKPKEKSQMDESLNNHLVGSDEPEMFLSDPGRPGIKRLLVGVEGLGDVRCGSCSTSNGCTAFWIGFNMNTTCIATPAAGHQFEFWTINGNFAGNKTPRRLGGKPGTKIVGKFVPKPDPDTDTLALNETQRWSLTRPNHEAKNARRTAMQVIVSNNDSSKSSVDVLINGGWAETVSSGDSSTTLDVPVASDGVALVVVKLVSGGTQAKGTTEVVSGDD